MSRFRSLALIIVVGIVAALAGALIAHQIFESRTSPILKSGTALSPPMPVPKFVLVDQDGREFDNAQLRGRWSLLFFGFTNCGDVCPTTLALLAQVTKVVGDLDEAKRPQVVFISVDPKRDTPEAIKKYLHNFDPTFKGATGAQNDVDTLTGALGVPSAIRPLDNGAYAVDHSAAILAVNPNGELSAVFTPPHTLNTLVADYRALVGAK